MRTHRAVVRSFLAAVIAASIAVGGGGVTSAAPEPPEPTPPDIVAPSGPARAPSAEQSAAAAALGADVRFDTETGGVRVISDVPAGATGETAEDAARAFLDTNAAVFGVDASTLVLRRTIPSPGGVSHVWFDQTLGGTKVFGAAVGVSVDPSGQVAHVASSLRPGLRPPPSGSIGAVDAVVATGESVGAEPATAPDDVSTRRSGSVTSVENPFETGLASDVPATAEPFLYPLPDGTTRPAWKTVVQTDVDGWYEAVVDARTGAVLERHNLWESDHGNGEGNVYTVQHPLIPGAVQQDVDFPVNWADTSGNTIGNNSDAWHDPDGDDAPGYRPDTGNPGDANFRHFNYTYTDAIFTSGGTDYVTDQDAVITQAFYYTNMLHDRWYGYGFDEASGNFQEDNFGLGGSAGDRVNVLVDWNADNGECCNASMATPADGSNPYLRLRIGLMPDNRDMHRAMNGDTVTHEFGHGVSNRLVGGGNLGSGPQAEGMGEGWSDAMAFSVWNDPVYGEYNNGNNTTGIRSVAYHTSTLQYDDICNGGCEEHDDGEVWATALWDVRAALIARYGDGPGTTRFELIMIDGMKFTPTSPSFLDARDGILQSDGGQDACLIWNAFAINGMGSDAADDGGGDSPTNGFAVPAECVPTADAGGPYNVGEGATIQLDATGSAPGTDPSAAPITEYAWDFDGDLDFDDAFGATPTFGPIGDDAFFNITLRVTSGDGLTATDTSTVTVSNVNPDITIVDGQTDEIDEGDTLGVAATFTDPGWLDTYTATIDFGTGAGPQPATLVMNTEGGPNVADAGTVTGSFDYGDNGTFTVTVTVTDDNGGVDSAAFELTVNNVDPTAAIDPTGSLDVNGVPTFILHAGEELTVSGDSTDPGSDDLTAVWDWGDGTLPTSTKYRCNPPVDDPFPSPTMQPRDITDTQSHTYGDACLYTLTFTVTDDDAGVSDPSVAAVVVQGNADLNRSAGYWYQQYRREHGGNILPLEDRQCYLLIVAHLSDVFNEVTNVSTFAQAAALLNGDGGPSTQKLDRQLLAAWLNFANGAVDLDELVDTNADGVADTVLLTALTTAESVRLNPASTDAQLLAQKDILESINLMDE